MTSNFKFGFCNYTWLFVVMLRFRQKQHINGQHPAEQTCKIWRKNFQALLSNHIAGVGSFVQCI